MSAEEIQRVALEHLDLVGLRDRAELMPDQLSAGMSKRVAIARALALDARIVIIDDFDSGIDGVRLGLLVELLEDVQRRSGATFLVSTHDMSAARQLADHIAVIHEGRIVVSGDAQSVLESDEPLVRQLISGGVAGPLQLRNV
jgi:ABC-type transporter Mla maintaining outer membrane lipid asymmetry ATPase subunit MlaF